MLAFVGILLYRGIKLGFTNTFFTLVTAILWIALAAAFSAALVFFVLKPLGLMQDVANAFRGAGDGIYSLLGSLGVCRSMFAVADGDNLLSDLTGKLDANYTVKDGVITVSDAVGANDHFPTYAGITLDRCWPISIYRGET